MNTMLRVGDCLCQCWLKVGYFQKYSEVMADQAALLAKVFAVFAEDGRFMGLVGNRQAALFPKRIFADLLVRRAADPVFFKDSLDEILHRFGDEHCEHLAVFDDTQQFVGVISEVSLFSTLIEQERSLRREREQMIIELKHELEYRKMATLAFDTTSEGILVTDAAGRIISVNQSFVDTTGYQPDEVIGKNPRLLQSGRQGMDFYRDMWSVLRAQGSWQGEIWNQRKNGEVYPEWLHINRLCDDKGKATYYVGVFSDIGPNKEIQRELQQMAYYDPLTGLPNRRLFMDRLEQTIHQSHRMQDGFALLFIDLDRFKNINDAYGHELGDGLLKIVAKRIREVVRDRDTVARLGGDEFTAILHDCHTVADIMQVVEKIRATISEPILLGGHELAVSAAIGISLYPEDGSTVTEVIRNSDVAMYRAKEEDMGISFYQPEMNAGVAERLEIESGIRSGLANGEFWLAWQAQVNLTDGSLCGTEVLARWSHDGREIPPSVFIPIAENAGLIDLLGGWVFRHAVIEASELKKQCPHCTFKMAVNFSPLQLKGGGAFQVVSDVLAEYDFLAESLEIEVTESAIMSKRPGATEFLRQAGAMGIAVAVDDFGTGYSNLSNLKQFHVDKLKIDQSFVADLTHNKISRQIVQAVIGMAHSIDLKVLAEGIETQAQLDILRELGCDYGQGYLFSRPVPMSEFKVMCQHSVNGARFD
jgi:diguanylate cyclase (GGDEF)-like protein/PAS domain S-box-containing protein